jgi:hypothetical protein
VEFARSDIRTDLDSVLLPTIQSANSLAGSAATTSINIYNRLGAPNYGTIVADIANVGTSISGVTVDLSPVINRLNAMSGVLGSPIKTIANDITEVARLVISGSRKTRY